MIKIYAMLAKDAETEVYITKSYSPGLAQRNIKGNAIKIKHRNHLYRKTSAQKRAVRVIRLFLQPYPATCFPKLPCTKSLSKEI